MSVIERWTIWHTPGTTPGTHKSYVEGPTAGDWAGQGVEVVPAERLRGAVEALANLREVAINGGAIEEGGGYDATVLLPILRAGGRSQSEPQTDQGSEA